MLESIDTGPKRADVLGRLRSGEPDHRKFDHEALFTSLPQLDQCISEFVDHPQRLRCAEIIRLGTPLGNDVGRLVDDLLEIR